jgi:hypothetical protein
MKDAFFHEVFCGYEIKPGRVGALVKWGFWLCYGLISVQHSENKDRLYFFQEEKNELG